LDIPYGGDAASSPGGGGVGLLAVGQADVVEVVDHERRRNGVTLVVVVATAFLKSRRRAENRNKDVLVKQILISLKFFPAATFALMLFVPVTFYLLTTFLCHLFPMTFVLIRFDLMTLFLCHSFQVTFVLK
jgi:hypothetical protein